MKKLCLALLSLCLLSTGTSAWSADINNVDKSATSLLARDIKEFRSSLKQISRSGQLLLNEYNRSNLQILEFGDFINRYIDGKSVPDEDTLYPYGFQNFGNTGVVQGPPLPPRPQWVTYYCDVLQKLIPLAKDELADIIASPLLTGDAAAFADAKAAMAKLTAAGQQLDQVRAGADKNASQHIVADIMDDVGQLDLTTKSLIRQRILPKK